MHNIQNFTSLWSDTSDASLPYINKSEKDSDSLLLCLLSSIKYQECLTTSKYAFPWYEIKLENYNDFKKIMYPKEVEHGKYEYKRVEG
ncbi:hypothetical protein HZS_812 [Henneguya salminicola]|nr:hypothetical protein HZS_812 [Henneguya salminicola]